MQTEEQRTASRAVANYLAEGGLGNTWLVDKAGADKGTVGAFLSGESWPRRATQGRIERALGWRVGTITGIAEGRMDPPVHSAPAAAIDLSALSDDDLLAEVRRRMTSPAPDEPGQPAGRISEPGPATVWPHTTKQPSGRKPRR